MRLSQLCVNGILVTETVWWYLLVAWTDYHPSVEGEQSNPSPRLPTITSASSSAAMQGITKGR